MSPRQDGSDIAPSAGAALTQVGHRHDMRYHPADFGLLFIQVVGVFGKKGGSIHIEAGSAREDLCVAGPAQPLVTLRAVGGDVEEVAFLSPQRIFEELVDL